MNLEDMRVAIFMLEMLGKISFVIILIGVALLWAYCAGNRKPCCLSLR